MKKIKLFIIVVVAGFCMAAISKPYEEFHSDEEESKWVSFVGVHPEIDFASYRMREDVTNGIHLINFAAGRNYYRLLEVMEQKGGAIRRFVIPDNTASPLVLALMFEANDAVDVLLKIRPEWANRFDPFLGSTPIYVSMSKNDVPGVKRLLEHGADADSEDGLTGQTLLQNAALKSLEMYELVRRHGGRQNQSQYLFHWKPELRDALLKKYVATACFIYPDRIVFASGVNVSFPEAESITNAIGKAQMNLLPLQPVAENILKQELSSAGVKGSGTLIMNCHVNSFPALAQWIEPRLDELNLVAIYVTEDVQTSFPNMPSSFVPTIQNSLTE